MVQPLNLKTHNVRATFAFALVVLGLGCAQDVATQRDAGDGHQHMHVHPMDAGSGFDSGAEDDAGEVTPTGYRWDLPPGFPQPLEPEDNPMSEAKVALGRRLFYDRRLSGLGNQSCSSCHLQPLAFTDGRARSIGSTFETHPRGALSLTNMAYGVVFAWANPLIQSLEQQAPIPMFGENPVELGLANREDEMLDRLRAHEGYPQWFAEAFPEAEGDPIHLTHVIRALASFQRTLISGRSAYDRFVYDHDASALSESQLRGRDLFFSETTECFHCHGGFNFSDMSVFVGKRISEHAFHNTALYNTDGQGAYPSDNQGVFEVTGRAEHMGAFKAPTLRNVAVTAPYMHDGSITSLEGVIDHYMAGGRADNPLKSAFIRPFTLTATEKADLIAFLHSLTDQAFLTDPRFSDPWVE